MYWNEKTIERLDLDEIEHSIKNINKLDVHDKIRALTKLIFVIKRAK